MSELAVLVDMDKTVLDTGRFVGGLTVALEAGFEVNQQAFRSQMPAFYVGGKDERTLRYYDFFAHANQLGLDLDEAEAYILENLAGQDYIYDDVPPFLDFLAVQVQPETSLLLTYGEPRFQQLKYACAPTLGSLACVDTLRPKGEYISKRFAGRRGVIIDDKIVDGLPSGFKHVWLARDEVSLDRKSYSSLGNIQEHWDEIIPE